MMNLYNTILSQTKTVDGKELPYWLGTLIETMKNIINPILILVALAGVIYAIVVGVKFARADEKGEREEAKKKLITVIIGIVVTGILILLFFWIYRAILNGNIEVAKWAN